MDQSLGEYRVGVDFNPSKDSLVDEIKRKTADLIDLVHNQVAADRSQEIRRLKVKAEDTFEEAAMWAVKAATKKSFEQEG